MASEKSGGEQATNHLERVHGAINLHLEDMRVYGTAKVLKKDDLMRRIGPKGEVIKFWPLGPWERPAVARHHSAGLDRRRLRGGQKSCRKLGTKFCSI